MWISYFDLTVIFPQTRMGSALAVWKEVVLTEAHKSRATAMAYVFLCRYVV